MVTPDRGDENLTVAEARSGPPEPEKILRFHRSERFMHWALAVPFLVCFSTALVLVFAYNPDPSRPYRAVFSWTHRLSGVAFIVLPLLAAVRYRGDARLHLHNIAQAWRWTFDDVRWLALVGLASVSNRVRLPEQGKFNAGEKINFMVILTTYPLYIATGLLVWLPGIAFFSWVLHVLMALVATPLLLGHLYMAVINPGSRKGLEGMITGFVDRNWARHHYRAWYREKYETSAPPAPAQTLRGSARICCGDCEAERVPRSWRRVLEAAVVACPACGVECRAIILDPQPWMVAFVEARVQLDTTEPSGTQVSAPNAGNPLCDDFDGVVDDLGCLAAQMPSDTPDRKRARSTRGHTFLGVRNPRSTAGRF